MSFSNSGFEIEIFDWYSIEGYEGWHDAGWIKLSSRLGIPCSEPAFLLPVVIILERSPFLPAFAPGSSQDVPDMGNDQFMPPAGDTSELEGIVIFHDCALSTDWSGSAFRMDR
jgi:hypothetical protein